jgi:hypothetical protein
MSVIMLYENVFQNPELFPTQVSLYPEHSTLVTRPKNITGTGIRPKTLQVLEEDMQEE